MPRIIFEFVGGPNDGEVHHGELGEPSDAERYFLFSNRGKVGQRLKVASEYAVEMLARREWKDDKRHSFQRHFYVVTDHLDDCGEIWVRAEYLPSAAESEPKS